MRAGVYRGKGSVVVETLPIPEIGEGEVLFRVAACGICGTDIKKIQHGFIDPPQILGHELAGTVVQRRRRGEKVQARRPRRRFPSHSLRHMLLLREEAVFPVRGLQEDRSDRRLRSQRRRFRPIRARHALDRRARHDSAASPVSFEEATFVEPVNTCLKALRKARVAAGETVLVVGQGPIGMLLGVLAGLEGATVFTSDPLPGRRAASVRFGAQESFDPAKANLREEMRRRTAGRGADAVLAGCAESVTSPGSFSYRAAGRSRATVCS